MITKHMRGITRMAAALAAAVFFAGCAGSIRPEKIDPVGIIGNDAQLYIAAPVKDNEVLLTRIMQRFFTKKTAKQYLSRTSCVYSGIVFDKKEMRVCSFGSYPASLSGNIFKKRDGWEKRRVEPLETDSKAARSISYYHSPMADVSLAVKGLALVCAGGLDTAAKQQSSEAFFRRVYQPDTVVLPPRFEAACKSGHTIALYSGKPEFIIAMIIGSSDITLPVTALEFYFSPQENGTYMYDAVFQTPDKRSAFFVKMLAGKFFSADTISVQDSAVIIEKGVLTLDRLASLL